LLSSLPGSIRKNGERYGALIPLETIKKLNAEQEVFIKATEGLRQTIYEKELYLKAELVKKDPDTTP
jgi:hypothetical protein